MDITFFNPNEGKNIIIETKDYGRYARYPIKTHTVACGESINQLIAKYVLGLPEKNDCLFISEKVIAICQNRAFDIDSIKPCTLAKILCKFVYKSPYGIGLGSPWTMELALRDVGKVRILSAAICSAVTKPFGLRGVFYKVAGTGARAIDGPCDCTIAPYNHYAKMAPLKPDKVAQEIKNQIGCKVVIIDANDIGVEVLGRSDKTIDIDFCKQVFKDNPLGQSSQSTPIAIVRKVK